MTILPLQNPNLSNSTGSQNPATAEKTAVRDLGNVRVSVSYSNTTTVTLGGAETQNLTYSANKVAKSDALALDAAPKNVAADNILSFISQRLATDLAEGASSEELQSRLAAALEGFSQGYAEAKEQLVGSGFLSPEVENLIQETFDQVTSGIEALAEKYGIESPLGASSTSELASIAPQAVTTRNDAQVSLLRSSASVDAVENVFAKFAEESVNAGENLKQLLQGAEFDYERFASRDFTFSLKTQDGDEVLISASAIRADQGSASANQVSASGFSSSQFAIEVNGDLDEEELSAISDLLSQIGELSSAFFAGDIEQAFELALNIGFNESEIAKFSLNLEQQVSTKVQATYAAFEDDKNLNPLNKNIGDLVNFAGGNNSLSRLADFVEMLQEVVFKTEKLGFDKSLVPEFAGFISDMAMKESPSAGSNIQAVLEKLGNL